MEPNKEEAYAQYCYELFVGHLDAAKEVDPLLAHVAMRRLIDHGINMVLDRWNATGTDEDDEYDGRGRE